MTKVVFWKQFTPSVYTLRLIILPLRMRGIKRNTFLLRKLRLVNLILWKPILLRPYLFFEEVAVANQRECFILPQNGRTSRVKLLSILVEMSLRRWHNILPRIHLWTLKRLSCGSLIEHSVWSERVWGSQRKGVHCINPLTSFLRPLPRVLLMMLRFTRIGRFYFQNPVFCHAIELAICENSRDKTRIVVSWWWEHGQRWFIIPVIVLGQRSISAVFFPICLLIVLGFTCW